MEIHHDVDDEGMPHLSISFSFNIYQKIYVEITHS